MTAIVEAGFQPFPLRRIQKARMLVGKHTAQGTLAIAGTVVVLALTELGGAIASGGILVGEARRLLPHQGFLRRPIEIVAAAVAEQFLAGRKESSRGVADRIPRLVAILMQPAQQAGALPSLQEGGQQVD